VAERGTAARAFTVLLVVVLFVGLAGAVVYLLSDINSRRYRVVEKSDQLVVERGRFLPFGFEPFVPTEDPLARAYAPIPLPPATSLPPSQVYEDRGEVDRLLFSLLAGWARAALGADDRATFDRASRYIARSELLPGVSEEQRVELRTLRADLAYKHGRILVDDSMKMLAEAKRAFELSLRLGTSRPTDAAAQIGNIERRIAENSAPAPAAPSPPPLEAVPDAAPTPPATQGGAIERL
jgi:hypothetical protein